MALLSWVPFQTATWDHCPCAHVHVQEQLIAALQGEISPAKRAALRRQSKSHVHHTSLTCRHAAHRKHTSGSPSQRTQQQQQAPTGQPSGTTMRSSPLVPPAECSTWRCHCPESCNDSTRQPHTIDLIAKPKSRVLALQETSAPHFVYVNAGLPGHAAAASVDDVKLLA